MRTPQKSVLEIVRELWVLLKTYGRQETIDPLRNLGRYLGFGIAGSVLMGLGTVFLALSGLRALQETTSVFSGFWSWVPYLLVLILLVALVAVTVNRILRHPEPDVEQKAAR